MNEEEVMEMISKEDDDVVIVGDEKLDTDSKAKSGTEDAEKDDSLNESNLTVTVTKHKKGRSVNDSDGVSSLAHIFDRCQKDLYMASK